MIDKRKVGLFLSITLIINIIIALIPKMMVKTMGGALGLVIGVVYMFIPTLVAIFVQKGVYKSPIKEPLGISFKINGWFFIGWVLPIIASFLAFGAALLIPGVTYSPGMEGMFEKYKDIMTPEQLQQLKEQIAAVPVPPLLMAVFQGLFAGVTVNAIAAFGEELGWRGFLVNELKPLGFWKMTLLSGFIWGVWHAPLVIQGHNYPQHPQIGVFMMIIWCILLTPLINYVRIKANSVVAAAIFHGTLNAVYGIAIMMIYGGNDLQVGLTGAAGFAGLLVMNLGLYLYDKYAAGQKIMV